MKSEDGGEDMPEELLSSQMAAKSLGISVASLYDWLARSDCGELIIRGRPFTITYFQGGARGQGRIQIEPSEIERLREAMRVRPLSIHNRQCPQRAQHFPGITVPLGRPD
ncbi:MAG: DNA-binding protein [Planctomycetaceae bacterium]